MNLPGVPDSIEWPKVRDFLESIGLDLHNMPAHRGGIIIANGFIKAIVCARDENGNRYADRADPEGGAAKHEVCIPIIDGPWNRGQPQSAEDRDTCWHVIQDGASTCDCGEMRIGVHADG